VLKPLQDRLAELKAQTAPTDKKALKAYNNSIKAAQKQIDNVNKNVKSYAYIDPVTGKQMSTLDRTLATELHKAGGDVFDIINAKIKENKGILPAEYFALESPNNTKKNAKNMDWTDFLPAGSSWATASSQDIANAQRAMSVQKTISGVYLDPSAKNIKGVQKAFTPAQLANNLGTKFDFTKTSNLRPPGGYNLKQSSPLETAFNLAVNAGLDPEDIASSLDPGNVWRKALEVKKKKKSGFGGFLKSIIPAAVAWAFPPAAPFIAGASGIYNLSQGNILGGLMSLAPFVPGNPVGSFTNNLTNGVSQSLTQSFNIAPAMADTISKAALSGSLSAISAAMNDQDMLAAFATGAGVSSLSGMINKNLVDTFPNAQLRNFVSSQLASTVANAVRSATINRAKGGLVLARGGLASAKSLPNNEKTVNMGSVASLHPDLVRTLKSRNLI
jgi:hypothetical protein